MKKSFVSTLFIVAVMAATVACGGGRKKAVAQDDASEAGARAANGLVVQLSDSLISNRGADTVDFGRVREGERVMREFMVRNAGDKAMVITKLDLSCGCVEAEYPKQPLMPGEERAVKFTLDTENLGGWIFKTAIMQTSLSSKGYVLYITAEVE